MDRGEGLNYGRIKLPPFDDDDDTDLGLKELPIGPATCRPIPSAPTGSPGGLDIVALADCHGKSNPPKSDTPRLDDLNATLFVSGSDGEPGLGNDFGQPLPGGPLNGGQAQRPLVSGPGGGARWEDFGEDVYQLDGEFFKGPS
ncbi:hypothetical protein CB1_002113001 [Camelus ferus]|nr:hypothetical protein CB1_002113001 [Camelus ferus]